MTGYDRTSIRQSISDHDLSETDRQFVRQMVTTRDGPYALDNLPIEPRKVDFVL